MLRLWRPYTIRVQGGHFIRSLHLRHTIRHLPDQPHFILVAGCGSGRDALYFAAAFPQSWILGIDLDVDELHRAERRRRRHRLEKVTFKQADLLALQDSEKYDLIYSVEVLEHLPDHRAAIDRLADMLAPGGTLVLHTPCPYQKRHWRRFEDRTQEDHEVEGLEPDALTSACRSARLSVVSTRYTFGEFGSLAWELFELVREYGGFAKRLLMPAILLLGMLDVHRTNRWGNNVLICASKPRSSV